MIQEGKIMTKSVIYYPSEADFVPYCRNNKRIKLCHEDEYDIHGGVEEIKQSESKVAIYCSITDDGKTTVW